MASRRLALLGSGAFAVALLQLLFLSACCASRGAEAVPARRLGGLAAAGARRPPQPEFKRDPSCGDLECPKFATVRKHKGFEVRLYENYTFAGALGIHDTSFKHATMAGFKMLFDYIQGSNKDNKTVEMTAPVATVVHPGPGPFCESEFMVFFPVPQSWKGQPPQPLNDSNIIIYHHPKPLCFAVRQFSGYADDDSVPVEASTLVSDMAEEGVEISREVYSVTQYEDPFQPFNRHNEIRIEVDLCSHHDGITTAQ
eukprot:jgi/Chlat1/7843/Chrsp66S07287